MSDEDDDLFADSGDDTDDLIAASKPVAKPKKLTKKAAPKKKKAAAPKRKIPDADNDSDDEPGLFDSDDEDDTPAKKAAPAKPMSKREKMEALQRKKRQEREPDEKASSSRKRKKQKTGDGPNKDGGDKKESGYDSGDSYNSAEYVRTAEDNDFIDADGDDEDALAELYADQHFDDERGEAEEEQPTKKKGVSGAGSSYKRSELAELRAEADDDNPLMQALQKMQRKKRVAKKLSELEDEARPFLEQMTQAADEDEEAVAQKRPALKKLTMIGEVCDVLAKKDMQRPLLENGLLVQCKRWIQPLPNGSLGNITVRRRMLQSLAAMNGEQGINGHDLKVSEFGKTIMSLYMHKSETPELKKILKGMIEAWSRPIFQRSDNMRDLERVHAQRGAKGISQISRTAQLEEQAADQAKRAPIMKSHRGGKDQDLNSLIKSGSKGKQESGINRVRVPFSRGFQFSVRPTNRTTGAVDKRRATAGNTQDARGKIGKRMVEKGRAKAKNQRSANISIEGRQTKL